MSGTGWLDHCVAFIAGRKGVVVTGSEVDFDQQPRSADDSELVLRQQMLPTDANSYGDVHGGAIMKLVDTAAGLAAMRHSRSRAVTVAVDSMSFRAPVHVGDLVHVRGRLTWVGTSSMEVEVTVEAEKVIEGTIAHTSTAYLVFVALDDEGKPHHVPPLLLESDTDRAKWKAAERRRQIRLGNA